MTETLTPTGREHPAILQLVRRVLREQMPEPVPAFGSLDCPAWRIGGELRFGAKGETLEDALPLLRDVWRRGRVQELGKAQGWEHRHVARAWAILPYESVPFTQGWEAWGALRERRAG